MSTSTSTDQEQLARLSQQILRWIIRCTSQAGSGHPTSSLSAVELMTDLMFGGHFRFRIEQPDDPANDRVIFSKGHASPLLYSLWAAAGVIEPDALMKYREFGSPLEGHPTSRFRMTEAATGSLGQGLSIGFGMALAARYIDRSPSRTFVLLGYSEMAEGAHLNAYRDRIDAFGWRCILIDDGHDHQQVMRAWDEVESVSENNGQPVMLIARTIKGKGVASLEDEPGHHGKPVDDDAIETFPR